MCFFFPSLLVRTKDQQRINCWVVTLKQQCPFSLQVRHRSKKEIYKSTEKITHLKA